MQYSQLTRLLPYMIVIQYNLDQSNQISSFHSKWSDGQVHGVSNFIVVTTLPIACNHQE